jgi:hypothetical protein
VTPAGGIVICKRALGKMADDFDTIIIGLRRLRQDIEEGIREGDPSQMTTADILNRLRALQAQATELQRPVEPLGFRNQSALN